MIRQMDFQSLALPAELVTTVAELGFKNPTPVQAQAIPALLGGRDVIGQSQTGSGKTAAFALPMLARLHLKTRRVQSMVLCPTRELCAQVAREIRKLGRRCPGLQVVILSGGAPIGPQLGALEKGVHVTVGTPGRVLDHLMRGSLDLASVRSVILDEADRMLEMGFQEDLEKILSRAPKDRQTVLFSATFPKQIEAMSGKYQRNALRITVAAETRTVESIRQVIYEAVPDDRFRALLWILEQNQPETAIVFCNFKTSVVDVARGLVDAGVSAGALHGDLEQFDRDRVMAKFRNHSVRILVATDVAARGIDVENLDLVVNYELPAQPEVYVHRVGRTGRAGQKGRAVSLFSSREKPKLKMIEDYARVKLQAKDLPAMRELDLEGLQDRLQKRLDEAVEGASRMRTLMISAGRKDKMRPGDILGALTGEAGGLSGAEIGKIEIHDRLSYVAVAERVFEKALWSLRNGRIKGRKCKVDPVR
jgi:ATP-independent RNA helicase DbpA